jgi:hypothetical protein
MLKIHDFSFVIEFIEYFLKFIVRGQLTPVVADPAAP